MSLAPVKERELSQAEMINKTRAIARKYSNKDYQVSVSASSSIAGSIGLGRGGSGVGYFIAGPDMTRLNEYANILVEKMKADPAFRDPDSSVEVGTPEIRVAIDRTKAADLGVRAGDVAQALNIMAAGQIVSSYSEGSNQYDVVVRADERFRRDRSNFNLSPLLRQPAAPLGLTAWSSWRKGWPHRPSAGLTACGG